MKYEYAVKTVPNEVMVEYLDALNLMGDDGWELVVEYMCEGVEESLCTFKRQRVEINPTESICDN